MHVNSGIAADGQWRRLDQPVPQACDYHEIFIGRVIILFSVKITMLT